MTSRLRPSRLIINEADAKLQPAAREIHPTANSIALNQRLDEPPAALASRVTQYLDSLAAMGGELQTAWLSCNERVDATAFAARVQIARAILCALSRAGGGLLVLAAGRSRDEEARRQHWMFASGLLEVIRGDDVSLSMVFGDEPLGPGVVKVADGMRRHARSRLARRARRAPLKQAAATAN